MSGGKAALHPSTLLVAVGLLYRTWQHLELAEPVGAATGGVTLLLALVTAALAIARR